MKKVFGHDTNNNNNNTIVTNIVLCTVMGSSLLATHRLTSSQHLHNVQRAHPGRTRTLRLVRQGTSLINKIGVQP